MSSESIPFRIEGKIVVDHDREKIDHLNDRAKEILTEFGKLKKEFENFSNSTEDLRKKAEAMIRAIDNHETRERQMSRSISTIDSLD